MAYPENCFSNLIGIRGTCDQQEAMYWIDDIPGIDLTKLASIAGADASTGAKTGVKLIESAARMMAADVEAIYDAGYKIENTLVNGCSTCQYMTSYATGIQRGITVKNNSDSAFTRMVIDKIVAKVNAAGTFHVVIDDGDPANVKEIEFLFAAGVEYEFTNINYSTKKKTVRIYLQESNVVPLAQLSCVKGSSGCGCSGKAAAVSDLIFTGTSNGAETQQAYGFIPCVFIRCDASDVLCYVAHSAPRMIGMALLYKTAELYFTERLQSTRNNKVAGTNLDDAKDDMKRYAKQYNDKLNGNGTRGVKDLVFTTLSQTRDICVVCTSLLRTSWATG